MNARQRRIRTGVGGALALCTAFVMAGIVSVLPASAVPTSTTGDITEFTDGLPFGTNPYGIVTGPDGDLWFVENGSNQISKIDPTTGAVTDYSAGLTGGAGLWEITDGPDGDLWFTESIANKIGKIDPTTGTITEYSVSSGALGITTGPDGDIWFTEYNGSISRIGQFDPRTGTTVREYSLKNGGAFPWSIAAGSDGNMWFTEDSTANKIGKVDLSTGSITEYALTGPANAMVIVAGPDGDLWFTENSGNRIGRFDPTTLQLTEFPIPTPSSRPQGITVGSDGNLWFNEWSANTIGRITPDGRITEFPIRPIDNVVKPYLITSGPDGNIWFTENPGNRIGRLIVAASQDVTPPVTSIALDPASPSGENGWYTAPVGVSITASDDGSGVASTRCVLDPATPPTTFDDLPTTGCAYLGDGASVSGDGEHTVWAASIDAAGNAETPVSASIRIDTTAPTVTCDASTFTLGSTGDRVTAIVDDGTSGPVDASVSTSATATTAGVNSAEVTGTDDAGNATSVSCSYLVAYQLQPSDGFSAPAPKSKWKAGSAVPIKIALGDLGGTVISDAEASRLAADCRVTFAATGVQAVAPACMKYDASKHQFIYTWKLGTPTGDETATATIAYAGTDTTTTRDVAITITQ